MPPEIINYIFTFIQSNTNQIMKHYIKDTNTYILNEKISGEK